MSRIHERFVGAGEAFAFDLDAQTLRFSYADAGVARVCGLPCAQWLAASPHLADLAHPDDALQITEAFTAARCSVGGHLDTHFRVVLPSGEVSRLRVVAALREDRDPAVFQGVMLDVSRERALEAGLEQVRERYALATSAAKVGVWDWDLVSGQFYLDPNIKRLLGYEDHEIPNDLERWTAYVHPDDREPVMLAATAHMEGRTPEYVFEHRMRHRNGSIRWILVRGRVIRDGEGRPVRFVGTDADITDRKLLEEKLDEVHTLEETRAGHDLHDGVGQELTGIAFLMKSLETRLAAEGSRHLSRAQDIGAALSQAISTTRMLARGLSPGLGDQFGLQGALRDLCERVSRMYGIDCEFRCDCAGPMPDEARSSHLYRIAQEALTNAVKHAQPGRIELCCSQADDCFLMLVEDDGRGVPEKPAPGGMGLRIMAHRARTIGGTLDVEPRAPQGTRVVCRCPLPPVSALEEAGGIA